MPRTGIEPVILSLLVIRFTTEPTGLLCNLVKHTIDFSKYQRITHARPLINTKTGV